MVRAAILESFRKLDPRVQVRKPVMFVVFIGSIFTTVIGMGALSGSFQSEGPPGFILVLLAGHHRIDAVRGHLLQMTGDHEAAIACYLAAAERTTSLPERRYLVIRAARLHSS